MVRWLVGWLLAFAAVLVGAPSSAAAIPELSGAATYAYDGHQASATASNAATERGPPTHGYVYTAYDADGHVSHGTSARSEQMTTQSTTTYTSLGALALDSRGMTTTGGHAAVINGSLTSLAGFGVAAKSETAVIGKVADLEKGVGANEYTLLDQLPNMGSPKLNWKQNSGVLRKVMSRGQPIRDASVGADGQLIQYPGSFLNAERYLLQD